MRLAILADMHGNLPALEAVLADAEEQDVDGIVVLPDGDPVALELYGKAGLLDLAYSRVELGATLAEVDEAVLICGHSHIAWHQEWDGRIVLNPGSVGFALIR